MAVIRPATATAATLFCHFVLFVVVGVFNFAVVDTSLDINFNYGIVLIFLSLISLLLGVTSPDVKSSLLRSILMTLSAMWASVGTYHVAESLTSQTVPDSQALFAGYGTFLLVFMFFMFGALYHRDRVSAIIALGIFLSIIFEICSLWRPLRRSAAAYYLLLAAVCLYLAVSTLLEKFKKKEETKKLWSSQTEERPKPRDLLPLGQAMNAAAAAVYAGHVTGIYPSAVQGFSWVLIAGIYLMVAAVVSVRRDDVYHGLDFFLYGIFWLTNGFNLMVIFVNQTPLPDLIAPTVILFVIFFMMAIVSLTREFFRVLQNLALCILCVAILVGSNTGDFVGGMGWISFILSLYSLAAHISRIENSGFKLPLGARLIKPETLTNYFLNTCKCCLPSTKTVTASSDSSNHLFSIDFTLGYSRYAGFETAGFALNAIAAVSVLFMPQGPWVLPWAVIVGGLAQMAVGSICFARGLSFESCAFFTFGSLWLIWGPARGLGQLDFDNSAAVVTGCIGFMSIGLLLLGLSSVINKAWTVLTFFFNLILVGVLLHAVNANGSFVYEIVITTLFVLTCLYCFIATALRAIWGRELLPMGKPFLQVSYLHSQGQEAFWADGRKASGVKAIADIMNRGGICGVPTDVVYILVAALKFPEAVERAYNTKKLAEDRPMSMWISKVSQVEAGREQFGELVWGLMNEIWPSTVSLVLPKGPWLQTLGVGASEKYIGRPDSIAVRMPDNAVTSHLIDQTGPVSVSSANPTGEADTTHHLQVLAKLGLENCDGILCSGPSPENMASTVVDCRKLSQGEIGFFRIGVVPRSHVEAILTKVKAIHEGAIPPSITSHGGPKVNEAYEDDDDNIAPSEGSGDSAVEMRSETAANSANTSFDRSSFGSVTGDGAHLIKDLPANTALPGSSSNGIDGHTNRTYETVNGGNQSNSPTHGYDHVATDKATNGRLEHQGSSSGSDPYEPMQVLGAKTGAQLIEARHVIGGKPLTEDLTKSESLPPVYNPLYIPPTSSDSGVTKF